MEKIKSSTRRDIINALKMHGAMTVEELRKIMGITPMGVRQHLATLERDALVAAALHRQEMGRPSYVYSLTSKAEDYFPKDYDNFAVTALSDIKESHGDVIIDEIFQKRANRICSSLAPRLKSKNLEGRLKELVSLLNETGCMASYEKLNEKTFDLKQHNCCIFNIAQKFRQACHYDMKLFDRLLNAEVIRNKCMVEGAPLCLFSIKARA